MKNNVLLSLVMLALTTLSCSFFNVDVEDPDDSNPSTPINTLESGELQAGFDALPTGDAEAGEALFNNKPCHICHTDMPIGPQFPGSPALAMAAETRVEGYSAELYLYEAIVAPGAHIVEGYEGGVMPGNFGEELSSQELANLVAYLMTMK
jgi:mono/diheme cytochrome c family protein